MKIEARGKDQKTLFKLTRNLMNNDTNDTQVFTTLKPGVNMGGAMHGIEACLADCSR